MYAFIDAHRAAYLVEPICRVLEIAPSAYYVYRQRQTNATRQSARAQRDAVLQGDIARVYRANHAVYGVRKVWRQLQRDGITAARCTVERLMRAAGRQGVVRGRRVRTTQPAAAATPSADLVQRQFSAVQPNHLWVADFTYVATWRGFVYVEYATLEWVAWFNTQRLQEPLGYVPPAEFEEQYHRAQATQSDCWAVN